MMETVIPRAANMTQRLENKIKQYKKDGKNYFSFSEKIVTALCHPDLYPKLMPCEYRDQPMVAYFNVLDSGQRLAVRAHFR